MTFIISIIDSLFYCKHRLVRSMQNPADFTKYNSNTLLQTQHFLEKHKDSFKWKQNEDILEVGCAAGSVTTQILYPFLKKYLNSLLAVDVFPPAIEIAKAVYKIPKITFQQMDFGDIKMGEKYFERFDKIFGFFCFHLVKPEDAWPKNLYKMLKKGGQAFGTIVQSPNLNTKVMDDQLTDISAPWNSFIQNKPCAMSFYGSKPIQTITNILSDAGFTIDGIAWENMKSSFNDKEKLIKTVRSYSFLAQYIPEEMKEDYLADFVRRMFEGFEIDENGYHYTMEVISFVATKK